MAANSETSRIDVIINGRQANESINEMRSNWRQLNAEVNKMPINSPEFAKGKKVLSEWGEEIKNVTGKVNQTGAALQKMFEVAGGMGMVELAKAGLKGLGTAITFVADMAKSADSASDKWEETVTGLTWSWDVFKKSLATGDFSNLISNMTKAISLGKEYAKIIDDVGNRTRSLSVNEADSRVELEKLKIAERNVALSKEDRIAAGKKALEIENDLMQKQLSIDKQSFDAEMLRTKAMTNLGDATIKMYFKNYDANKRLIDQAENYLDLKEKISLVEQHVSRQGGVNTQAINDLKKYNDAIKQIPSDAIVYSTVVKSIGKLSDEEMTKLTQSWAKLGQTQQNSIKETSRIQITLSRLNKGIIDEGIKEDAKKQKELEKQKTAYQEISVKIEEYQEALELLILSDPKQAAVYAEKIARLKSYKKAIDDSITSLQGQADAEKAISEMKSLGFGGFSNKSMPKPGEMQHVSNPEPGNSGEGLPVNVWGQEGGALGVDVWGAKAEAVMGYAQTALNALAGVDSAMSAYENAQLAKDEESNNKKKSNLKRQLDGKIITQKQYDAGIAKLDADMDKKKKELAHKQAVRSKELALVQAIINVAQAVTAALSAGPIIGIILAALVGILGAVQIGYIASTPVPAAAKGRYNVIGQQDGKAYSDVPYQDSFTGIPGRPMLVNETGNELVIDPATTKNLMLNYPEVIKAINFARVPQMASGYYPSAAMGSAKASAQVMIMDPEYIQALKDHTEALKKPSKNYIVWQDLQEANEKMDVITKDLSL